MRVVSGSWVVWVVFLVLLTACGRPPLTPPSQGGERWVELTSEHFTLVTDLGDEDAAKVVGNLEQTYALLEKVAFRGRTAPSFHTQAIIFREHRDLKQFVGDDVAGRYLPSLPNELEPTPTVLASSSLNLYARVLFAHELVHRFNHVALGPTPVWLNEGLAQYYSTIREERGTPVIGETDPRTMCASGAVWQRPGTVICNYEVIRAELLPRPSELIALDGAAFYSDEPDENGLVPWEAKLRRSRNYAAAWLFVHLLMHEKAPYAERFREIVQASDAPGKRGERLAAWVRTVPAHELDRAFAAYLDKLPVWRQQHVSLPPALAKLGRRVLNESEVLTWWARLDDFDGDSFQRAYTHLRAAEASTPDDADVRFWLARYEAVRHHASEAHDGYQEALRLDPGNPEYLLALLELYLDPRKAKQLSGSPEERVAQVVSELERTCRTARQLNAVGAYYIDRGDFEAGLRHTRRAVDLEPGCWQCFHNSAVGTFGAGDVQGAIELQRHALQRVPEHADPEIWGIVRAALELYERASRDASAVGSPRPMLFAP